MALAVCALFDDAGERLIRGLWARVDDAGIASMASHTHGHHHPHLSYAVLLEGDLGVALAVAVPAQVALRQDRVASELEATGAQLHRHYRPTSWIPHVSVVTHASASLLPVAVTAIFDVLPVTLTVASAALVDTATGEIWPLPGIP